MQVYHFDHASHQIVMQFIPPPHLIMRKHIIAGTQLPHVASHMATFLSQTLFFSSPLHVPASKFREQVGHSVNAEMCKLTEAAVFTDPFVASDKVSKHFIVCVIAF